MIENLLNGLFKFFAWFWSRPMLRVRISADNVKEEVGGLKFEVENVSDKTTSLNPNVTVRFLTIKRELHSVVFDVRELDGRVSSTTKSKRAALAYGTDTQQGAPAYRSTAARYRVG